MTLGVLIAGLIVSTGVLVWICALLIGDISAAVYIPTPDEHMNEALAELNMKPGKTFVDLGSGDGKLVMAAAQRYKVRSVGYEINPLLVIYSRLAAGIKKVHGAVFREKSFWAADLSEFNYVYAYLYPPAMKKLAVKLEKELRKGSTVVSKAFEIKEWKDKLVKKRMVGEKVLWVYRI